MSEKNKKDIYLSSFKEMFERNSKESISSIKYIVEMEVEYDRALEAQYKHIDEIHGNGDEKFEIYPLTDEDILAIYHYEQKHLTNSLQVAHLIYLVKDLRRRVIEELKKR